MKLIHHRQSAQISKKQDWRNIYVTMKTIFSRFSLKCLCGNLCIWETIHHVPKFISCQKVIVVIGLCGRKAIVMIFQALCDIKVLINIKYILF